MKVFFQLLLLPTLLLACASHNKQTHPAPSESDRSPTAAAEIVILNDKYADTQVIFCDEKTAVVTSDPNKCGEATAKGARGCTEIAGYISELLKVEKAGTKTRLLDATGKAVHELTSVGADTFTLSLRKNTPLVSLSRAKADGTEASLSSYYCKK